MTDRPLPRWLAAALRPWRDVPNRLSRLEITMATQADIDALAQKLTGLRSALDSGNTRIQAEIERLRSQSVDVTGLEAAVSSLSDEVNEAVALVPEPAPTEPVTEPAPDPVVENPGPVTEPAPDPAVDPAASPQDPTVQ